ncbi:MAG: ABC transporter substrate-binding protein, partial [Gallionellaceae bacterium]|nr:ABC transporter substrate-binding protein [Gallionellaceae bacterium]
MNHEDKLSSAIATSVPTPTVELPGKASAAHTRRDFLQLAGGAALMSMVPPGVPGLRSGGAWAAGSDAPEKKEVRIGFIPLTDCSSVVMAAVNKFDEKYGIKIIPTK